MVSPGFCDIPIFRLAVLSDDFCQLQYVPGLRNHLLFLVPSWSSLSPADVSESSSDRSGSSGSRAGLKMRLAGVSPFLDRQLGTELCIIEQIERLLLGLPTLQGRNDALKTAAPLSSLQM